jgi:hypothetical protein
VEVWLEKLDFPLLLTKQVFKNENATVGELYLACSDLNLSYDKITPIYKKRWVVEEYHKSIKSNTAFAKSPTKKVATQMSHFAMKTQIYLAAQQAVYTELKKLSTPKATLCIFFETFLSKMS